MAILQIRLEDRARKGIIDESRWYKRGMVLAVRPDSYRPKGRMSRKSFGWINVPDLTAKEADALLEPDWAGNPPDIVKLATDPNYAEPEPYKPRKILIDPTKFRAEVSLADRTRSDDAWTWGKDQGDPVGMLAVKFVKTNVSAIAAVG